MALAAGLPMIFQKWTCGQGLAATGSANARPLYQRETLVQFCA
jgi:hypothetical protein